MNTEERMIYSRRLGGRALIISGLVALTLVGLLALARAQHVVVWPDWTFHKPTRGDLSPPTMVDGTLYVSGLDGYVYAVDGRTGQGLWRTAVSQGLVYVGTHDRLYVVDAARPTILWSAASGWVSGAPLVVDGRVYLGIDSEGALVAFS
jgi:outer membrane protein assembly factor BamB